MALLYGKPIADKILSDIREQIARSGVVPGLAVVLVGDDSSSRLYVGLKERAAREVGIYFETHSFPETVSEEELMSHIETLNERKDIHGIIVQLPLPRRLNADIVIEKISPEKDADGFHPETVKKFLAGDASACPVFPRAMMELLRFGKGYCLGERALVIGNSELFGRVMIQALSLEGLASEFIVRSETSDEQLIEKMREAKVMVTACGISEWCVGGMIGEGAIIIDGGISVSAGKVKGDVERVSVEKRARFLTPVPGGVGPVTIAVLLARVASAAL
ncbi:MAG: bifunctional 5,10-methylenetetrahydrofolate dehydrogenase/5,10-methenyltetrahydrofolate cyclohydrolase [Candidatus Moranbacteria bacterium]|nr:bifunctional 5,10-methylenetetrahydrofolate dehydrogenase/5,10-methenyltetrahydrofolate cyclohydrolase [Candidatus Moranbacteria bacterium]